ncbi:MAG TPA: 30S ribosome-binding factor RbfA [Pyrinomonadaceae bacterium]|jgi:ribosome-binding factor A|nr:30S ribosome-binding factor RbfA [Pyrinomonadaceae bacterium]
MRRPEKVAEHVREEIAQIVGYELDDPRVAIVTVTDVRMSDNLREARVFVMLNGTDEEAADALKALRKAAPYVRRQLAINLNLRHAPEIHFIRDTVEEKAARVDELLRGLTHDDAPQSDAADNDEAETGEEITRDQG